MSPPPQETAKGMRTATASNAWLYLLTTHRMSIAERWFALHGRDARVLFWEAAVAAEEKFPIAGAFPKRRGPSPKGVPAAPTLCLASSYHAVGTECEGGCIHGRQPAGRPWACRCWSYAWCWP